MKAGVMFCDIDNVALKGKLIEVFRGFADYRRIFGPVQQVNRHLISPQGQLEVKCGAFYIARGTASFGSLADSNPRQVSQGRKIILNSDGGFFFENHGTTLLDVWAFLPYELPSGVFSKEVCSKLILSSDDIHTLGGLRQVTRHLFIPGKRGGNHKHIPVKGQAKVEMIYVAEGAINIHETTEPRKIGPLEHLCRGDFHVLEKEIYHALHAPETGANISDDPTADIYDCLAADVYEFTNVSFDPSDPKKGMIFSPICLVTGERLLK